MPDELLSGITAKPAWIFYSRVTVVHRRDELRASKIMGDRATQNEKIELLWDSVVEEVLSDGTKVTGMRIKNVKNGEVNERPVGGFFVGTGWSAALACAVVGWIVAAQLLGCSSQPEVTATPPNIVLILIDDLAAGDPGFMGNTVYDTPRLDRLALEGLVFDQAYAAAANCKPSRESMLSGQYPPRHGIYTAHARKPGGLIPVDNAPREDDAFVTLAESLQSAGYATALFGKWHREDPAGPHGFDVAMTRADLGYARWGQSRDDGRVFLVDELTDLSIDFIDKTKERPFFLYLSHYAVHSPREAPATIVEQYRERLAGNPRYKPEYAAMLTHVDQSIGRLLDHLEARSLANNTFVVVTSDNGGSKTTVQNGLRGVKATLYEGGIRVPLILRWPGRSPEGNRTVVPVIGTDLFPTLMAAAGVPSPAGQPLDGLNLLPVLRGESIQRKALYWHLPSYTFASAPVAAMREGRWKLIEFFEDEHLELYDLENDPGEGRDLSSANPARRDDLFAKMRVWRESLNAPIPARRE